MESNTDQDDHVEITSHCRSRRCYHTDDDCPYYAQIRSPRAVSRSRAESMGLDVCDWCRRGGPPEIESEDDHHLWAARNAEPTIDTDV